MNKTLSSYPLKLEVFTKRKGTKKRNYLQTCIRSDADAALYILENAEDTKLGCKDDVFSTTKLFIKFQGSRKDLLETVYKAFGQQIIRSSSKTVAALLMNAIKQDDSAQVKKILAITTAPNDIRDPQTNMNALGMAAAYGTPAMIQFLVKTYNMNVNDQYFSRMTPTHLASSKPSNFFKLKELGADPFSSSKYGYTPLWFAIEQGQAEVIDYYLQKQSLRKVVVTSNLIVHLIRSPRLNEAAMNALFNNITELEISEYRNILKEGLMHILNQFLMMDFIRLVLQRIVRPEIITTTSSQRKPPRYTSMTKPLRAVETYAQPRFNVRFPLSNKETTFPKSVALTEMEYQVLRDTLPPAQVIHCIGSLYKNQVLFELVVHLWGLSKQDMVTGNIIHNSLKNSLRDNHVLFLIGCLPHNRRDCNGKYEIEYIVERHEHSIHQFLAQGLKPYYLSKQEDIQRMVRIISHSNVLEKWVTFGLQYDNLSDFFLYFRKHASSIKYYHIKISLYHKQEYYIVMTVDNIYSMLQHKYNMPKSKYSLKFYRSNRTTLSTPLDLSQLQDVEVITHNDLRKQLSSFNARKFIDIVIQFDK